MSFVTQVGTVLSVSNTVPTTVQLCYARNTFWKLSFAGELSTTPQALLPIFVEQQHEQQRRVKLRTLLCHLFPKPISYSIVAEIARLYAVEK